MSSLIEQLQQIEQQKRVLISGVLDEIRQRIELLNAAGFRYRLVDESAAPDKGRGTGGQRRKTSQEAFLSKVRAASFRKWGKLAEAKKEELWRKEEPLAKTFYSENYQDGANTTGRKYRTAHSPATK